PTLHLHSFPTRRSSDLPYLILQTSTTLILILAANTAFADFPRLSSILAKHKFMPHQMAFRGDRLAFVYGITILGFLAGVLLLLLDRKSTRLNSSHSQIS